MRKLLACSAIIYSVCIVGCTAATSSSTTAASPAPMAGTTLHDNMRRLWSDHAVWTRQYIVAATSGDASADAALARLKKNQEYIGNAIRPFYGDAAGAK